MEKVSRHRILESKHGEKGIQEHKPHRMSESKWDKEGVHNENSPELDVKARVK